MVKILTFLPALLLPVIFLLCDSAVLFLCHTPILQATATCTFVFLLYGTWLAIIPWYLFITAIFSFLCVGRVLYYPFFVIGIVLLLKGCCRYTTHRLALLTATIVMVAIASCYLLGVPLTPRYTIACLAGNLGVMCMSLKWFSAVKRGNRSWL